MPCWMYWHSKFLCVLGLGKKFPGSSWHEVAFDDGFCMEKSTKHHSLLFLHLLLHETINQTLYPLSQWHALTPLTLAMAAAEWVMSIHQEGPVIQGQWLHPILWTIAKVSKWLLLILQGQWLHHLQHQPRQVCTKLHCLPVCMKL